MGLGDLKAELSQLDLVDQGSLLQQRPLIHQIELRELSFEVAKPHQSTLSARSTMNCPATARVSRE